VQEAIQSRSLAELYERHADGGVRLAYILTGDAALAEDLLHEAFVKLAGRFVHLRNPAAFPSYLRRTIINLANSHFRRRRIERRALERATASLQPHAPETDMGDRETLKHALLRLPPRQRAAIVLRFYEDLSERQTADVLGCPVGTVKSLVARGMLVLRNQLQGV
jgi:RNA polymerase sigma-70 factor (sigma-E family)